MRENCYKTGEEVRLLHPVMWEGTGFEDVPETKIGIVVGLPRGAFGMVECSSLGQRWQAPLEGLILLVPSDRQTAAYKHARAEAERICFDRVLEVKKRLGEGQLHAEEIEPHECGRLISLMGPPDPFEDPWEAIKIESPEVKDE